MDSVKLSKEYFRNAYNEHDWRLKMTFQIEMTTDKTRMTPEGVRALLAKSYWAKDRTVETISRAMENSLCYGLLEGETLVGFARVVTDHATMYWVCDVIVDEGYRGYGLGKNLMEAIITTPELDGLLGILATADAHGLYEQYGFNKNAEKFMMKPRT